MTHTQSSDEKELEKALQDRFREIGMLTKHLVETEAALKQERAAHSATKQALAEAEYASQSYHKMLESTSWKLTAPLRRVVTTFRR